ncbi:AT-hook motif nuclear-localized protein 10-like [Coffea arabica]|uniref:AT-hook motif nuclear-localized protein n=1 Tax=Coffea arabica TaxID=13443 RepID=A0ABM4U1H2_COFAR
MTQLFLSIHLLFLAIVSRQLQCQGLYEIVRLSGFFFVSNNGQVQLSDSLKLTFRDPDGGVFGGPVIGSLIAATPLQVAVLTFIHDA